MSATNLNRCFFYLTHVIAIIHISCNSGKVILKEKLDMHSTIICHKGFFAGRDYFTVKKTQDDKTIYALHFSCKCKPLQPADTCSSSNDCYGLSKTTFNAVGHQQDWVAITQLGDSLSFFGETYIRDYLITPIEFMSITGEELFYTEKSLQTIQNKCCYPSTMPLNKIIGYIKIK